MKERCTPTRLLGQCTLGNGHNQKESYQFVLNIQNPRTRKSLNQNQYWNQRPQGAVGGKSTAERFHINASVLNGANMSRNAAQRGTRQ